MRMMRVGYDASVTLGTGGGIARYTLELLRAMVQRRASNVEFVVLLNSLRHKPNERHAFLFAAPNVRVVRRPLPGGWLVRRWGAGKGPSWEFLTGAACDVVHAPASYVPPTRARRFITVHDLFFLGDAPGAAPLAGDLFRQSFPTVLPAAHGVLTLSHYVRREVVQHFPAVAPERVHVAGGGIDHATFHPGVALAPATRSRFGLEKPYVLAVTEKLPRKRPEWLAPLGEFLASRGLELAALGLPATDATPSLRVLPRASEQELAELYAGSAAVLLTARAEGFGFPLAEALACGARVVAARHTGFAEVGGEAPTWVREDSLEGFREALAALPAAAPEAEERAVRAAAVQALRWDAVAERTLRAYGA